MIHRCVPCHLGSQNPSPDEKNGRKFRTICQLADTTSRDALNAYSKGPRPSGEFAKNWPKIYIVFSQPRSHHVMSSTCRSLRTSPATNRNHCRETVLAGRRRTQGRALLISRNFEATLCPLHLLTNPGTTPITILAVNSDHGLS